MIRRWIDAGLIELLALATASVVLVYALGDHWWRWLGVAASIGIWAYRIRGRLRFRKASPDGSTDPKRPTVD